MSAPVTTSTWSQPSFSDSEKRVTGTPVEPTTEELERPATEKISYWWVYVLLAIFVFIVGPIMGTQSLLSRDQVLQTSLCSLNAIKLKTVAINGTHSGDYCATPEEYSLLLAQAKAQYIGGLDRGKPVYAKWLKTHALNPKKVANARELQARNYICALGDNLGDGALYAATQAEVYVDTLDIQVGTTIITIDGDDPAGVACDNGVPMPVPSLPKMQPKRPGQDPAINGKG
jgi:hypothetical protein